jgi:hypothetical protein
MLLQFLIKIPEQDDRLGEAVHGGHHQSIFF